MHELGITQCIVDIAEKTAREQGADKILSVTIEVGALSGVVPDALEFCFEACTHGTLLEGSRLIIDHIPGRGRCVQCGAETEMDTYTISCPACGAFGLQRQQGEELRIKELEVD